MSDTTVPQATIAEVVKQVLDAMAGAVKQYGPDAVDLAVMAYRVDAIQQIVQGVVLAVLAVAVVKAFTWLWAWTGRGIDGSGPYDGEGYEIGRFFGSVGAAASFLASVIGSLNHLIDVSAWAAVFGYPELRIAMKALTAAGLM